MDHAHFTPLASLVGGLVIGLATALLWMLNGRIAGISGIVGHLLRPERGETRWRLAFVIGLVASGFVMHVVHPASFGLARGGSGTLIVAGLMVGFGTRLGSGCTSGHGLCGMARLSPRSIAATLTFMAVGMATAFAVRVLGVVR
ncbi:MAG TPA: YeeE/YedE family protein [Polyangia bacterium]|jgi:hypothetical protein|nr:YeeE/YedE family protein [Polyangia bacterium]